METYNQTHTPNTTIGSLVPRSTVHSIKAFHFLGIALAFLIIVMNMFVLIIFKVKKKLLLKSPVNIILCSFSVNDAIAGLSILFHVVPIMIEDENMVAGKYKKTFDAGYIISKLCLLSSVGHLVLLSCDRLLAVVSPFKHQTKFTRGYAIIWLLVVWSIAISFSMMELMLSGILYLKIRTLFIFICFVLIPLVILLHQNIITFLFLRKNVKKCKKMRLLRHKASCKKALMLHLIMSLSFFVCVAPFVCIRITIAYDRKLFKMIPGYVRELVFLLRFLTSFTNALVFTIYKADFMNIMKVLFCCKQKAKEELELILLKRTNSLRRSSYSCQFKHGQSI